MIEMDSSLVLCDRRCLLGWLERLGRAMEEKRMMKIGMVAPEVATVEEEEEAAEKEEAANCVAMRTNGTNG